MTKTVARRIGYARVSTMGQTFTVQLDQLRAARCQPIFQEKASGARSDWKELAALLRSLQPGDVATVTAIDQLARSVFDLFVTMKRIEEAGAVFRSLCEPWADTSTATGRIMVAVMDSMGEVEREIIYYTRTQESRSRAKANEVKFGRKPKLNPEQQRQVVAKLVEGEAPADIARTYGVNWRTITQQRPKVAR